MTSIDTLIAEAADLLDIPLGTTPDELLAELGENRSSLDRLRSLEQALYERRIRIFEALRAQDPPVTQRVIADIAGISEVAVIQALRRHRG